MFILSYIPNDLEFLSANHASAYESSEFNAFKSMTFLGEISNN